jgi:hypothetical protein
MVSIDFVRVMKLMSAPPEGLAVRTGTLEHDAFCRNDKTLNRARKLKSRACSSCFDGPIKTGQALAGSAARGYGAAAEVELAAADCDIGPMSTTDVIDRPTRTNQIKRHAPEGFEGMRRAGRLAAECLDLLVPEVKPGVTT